MNNWPAPGSRFHVVTDLDIIHEWSHCALILLVDIGFWNQHWDELQQWCQDYHAESQGMTVNIPDEPSLTAFCLKWT